MADAELEPQALIDFYGLEAPVVVGNDMSISLGQALAAEALFCPADTIARQDRAKRVAYLATMLAAAGSLKPEHAFLLGEQD